MALQCIIDEVKKNNLPSVLTLIDYKNAFNSTNRGEKVHILRPYGIPPRVLQAIGTMNLDTRAKVTTLDGESEEFKILVGELQGDTLAPFLFFIVLDYALRKAIENHKPLIYHHPKVIQVDRSNKVDRSGLVATLPYCQTRSIRHKNSSLEWK